MVLGFLGVECDLRFRGYCAERLRESPHRHTVRGCADCQDLHLPVRQLFRLSVLHILRQALHAGH